MSWLNKVRNKSREEKIRLIWIIVIVSAVLLLLLWVLTSKIGRHLPKDTTLFQTIGSGIKNIQDNYKK